MFDVILLMINGGQLLRTYVTAILNEKFNLQTKVYYQLVKILPNEKVCTHGAHINVTRKKLNNIDLYLRRTLLL